MTNKNLDLWNKVSKTKKEYTKNVSLGARKYTTIQPQYQLQKGTEQFGKYGETWGLKNLNYQHFQLLYQILMMTLYIK